MHYKATGNINFYEPYTVLCNPKPSRGIYRRLVNSIVKVPLCLHRWNTDFNFNENQWTNIFSAPFCSVSETKIQYFQYRCIQRIVGVNSSLFKMKLVNSPSCTFCGLHEESITHLFWECQFTSKFILDVELAILGSQFVFSISDILFSY